MFKTAVQGRRLNWVSSDSYRRSERCFKKLYQDLQQPTFVINGNSKIIQMNQAGTILFSKLANNKISQQKNISLLTLFPEQEGQIFQEKLIQCGNQNKEGQVYMQARIMVPIEKEAEEEQMFENQENSQQFNSKGSLVNGNNQSFGEQNRKIIDFMKSANAEILQYNIMKYNLQF
ncbi:hypothetical protein PPERSA_08458 [Pseudocohnilembus persalinus]|uniref:PAS domain-containing protein n=1 Tax=Pseudocohnilembus persalinus TaxID=266149 RepID=A0A0V0R6E3_PSEPJ|nr:hypothetical protein PPERSA_08458 [Pseudocohnilembus persalinus]|eukprot:KRX10055.1 hypothetical protein PPERSA_08458 [Pseudocohnilembus persalinus]